MIESVEEFLELCERDDEESRHRLRWDTASPGVWRETIQGHPEWKRTVTLNKVLDDEALALLATDEDQLVRSDIAHKRKLSRELFGQLAADREESIRAGIACNPKAPEDLVRKLAADPSPFVREVALRRLERS